MNRTKVIRIGFAILVAGVLALLGFTCLGKAKQYSGPSIQHKVFWLEVAKARWQRDHPNGAEWPKKQDLLPYLPGSIRATSFDKALQPHYGEIYIINRTGAPVYAYLPSKERLVTASSNMLPLIEPHAQQMR